MTAKSVLVRPQGLRPGGRAPTYLPPCYATAKTFLVQNFHIELYSMLCSIVIKSFVIHRKQFNCRSIIITSQ